ncbi:hypothetical protein PVAP13_8KG021220 [Panicum virgatum]|uniref:Uncharacterized protein n=1 Tax=Panicum virgatum TaxID=38727 RepID=A0A8T0PN65_PANVG|nr:hypothetical protein PVAP13_8KG021220 [Panicum virgatum]KAG2559645.1 hypothetical protein PVAP13_8KG021220 [Panicum virgatum]
MTAYNDDAKRRFLPDPTASPPRLQRIEAWPRVEARPPSPRSTASSALPVHPSWVQFPYTPLFSLFLLGITRLPRDPSSSSPPSAPHNRRRGYAVSFYGGSASAAAGTEDEEVGTRRALPRGFGSHSSPPLRPSPSSAPATSFPPPPPDPARERGGGHPIHARDASIELLPTLTLGAASAPASCLPAGSMSARPSLTSVHSGSTPTPPSTSLTSGRRCSSPTSVPALLLGADPSLICPSATTAATSRRSGRCECIKVAALAVSPQKGCLPIAVPPDPGKGVMARGCCRRSGCSASGSSVVPIALNKVRVLLSPSWFQMLHI